MKSSWQDLRREILSKPETQRAYEAMAAEYEIARSVIRARLCNKMTQQQLADKCGMTQNMIAKIESGHCNPTFNTLSKVAGALGKELKLV